MLLRIKWYFHWQFAKMSRNVALSTCLATLSDAVQIEAILFDKIVLHPLIQPSHVRQCLLY